jgi:type II secretory pathway pseudopilin PulG
MNQTPIRFKRTRRSGYAILETLTAVALITAATAGLVNVAQVHARLRQADEQNLAARLLASNVIERLRQDADAPSEPMLETLNGDYPLLKIQIDERPVKTAAVVGKHFVVSVHEQNPKHASVRPLVQEHYWSLGTSPDPAEQGATP